MKNFIAGLCIVLSLLLAGAAMFLIVSFLIAIPVFYIWNALVPALFGLSVITYWQSVLLLWLSWLLVRANASVSKK